MILILAVAATPAPAASPAPDPCGTAGGHTALLSTLNRPTIGFSPCAVKPRESVLEFGYANQAGDTASTTYPQGDLRFGLAPSVEFSLLGPAYQVTRAPAAENGFLDWGAGLKWEAAHTAQSALGFDFLYTVPNGARAFTAGKPTATINADYGTSLSDRFAFGTTIGYIASSGGWLPSVVFTNAFNTRAQFYAEAYAQTKMQPGGGTLFGLDGGIQYLITPALEVDFEAGSTSSEIARAHYLGAGVGVRL